MKSTSLAVWTHINELYQTTWNPKYAVNSVSYASNLLVLARAATDTTKNLRRLPTELDRKSSILIVFNRSQARGPIMM